MAISLRNSFTVALPVEKAWPLLNDIERVAPCVPGTRLTERVDDNTFKGEVSVKLGPVAVTFAGTAAFESRDDVAHTAVIKARGNEKKGRGGTSAVVHCRMTPDGDASRVEIDTALELFGQVAQYGRAAGAIAEVAGVIVDQFAECLSTRLVGAEAAPPSAQQAPASLSALSIAWRALKRWLKRVLAGGGTAP